MIRNCPVCKKEFTAKLDKQTICSRACVAVLGGRTKVPKGFAISGKASEAGKKGGKISKRK